MTQADPKDPVGLNLRTIQIINVALILGVVFFLAITCLIRFNGKEPLFAPDPLRFKNGTITPAALMMGVPLFVMSRIVSRRIVSNQRKTAAASDVGLLGLFSTSRIVELAMIEGAVFFNLIAFMLEGNPLALVVALLGIGLMAIGFPTRDGLENWMKDQAEQARLT